MKLKRTAICVALVLLVGPLSGCLYLRLMEFKKQLSRFDDFFEAKEEQGLKLLFSKPVLLSGDIVFLLKLGPTKVETDNGRKLWIYTFEKRYRGEKTEEGNFDVSVTMVFVNDKLCETRFPPRFLAIVPKPFLVRTLRSLAHAKVNPDKRSAKAELISEGSPDDGEVPRRREVLKFLGDPFEVKTTDKTITLTYRYYIKKRASGSGAKKLDSWASLTFRKKDDKLVKMRGQAGQIKIWITNPTEKSGKKTDARK